MTVSVTLALGPNAKECISDFSVYFVSRPALKPRLVLIARPSCCKLYSYPGAFPLPWDEDDEYSRAGGILSDFFEKFHHSNTLHEGSHRISIRVNRASVLAFITPPVH